MVEKYKLYSGIFFGALWVLILFQFVSQEILTFLRPLHSYLFFLIDVIFIVMGVLTLRKRNDILVVVSFVIIVIISSFLLNHDNKILVINGTRSYIGMLFTLPIVRYFSTGKNGARFMRTFDRTLYLFLLIQVPCVVWQYIKYGPGDRVGGSLGDWHSGEISALIYAVSFYLILKKWDTAHYLRSLRENKQYLFLLLPSFLNETKASFIYLVLYFILLFKVDRTMLRRVLIASPFALVVFSGLGFVYLRVTGQEADVVLSMEFVNKYFIGENLDHSLDVAIAVQDEGLLLDENYDGIFDMPRFAKLIFVPKVLKDSHRSLWFGAGLGQFKGDHVLQRTPFAKKNQWLLLGSKPWLFYVFVELGLVGVAWMIITLLYNLAFRRNKFIYGMNIKIFMAATFLLYFLYLEIFTDITFCLIVFYILFRTQVTLPDEATVETGESNATDKEVKTDSALALDTP